MKHRLDNSPAGNTGTGDPVSKPAGFSLRNIQTFSSFKNPVYRLYYGSMMGQIAAMNMQNLALSLLIYRLTNSAAMLGLLSLAGAIPMIILSLYGGVIADRMQKKNVLIIGQSFSALIALLIALALHTGYTSAEHEGSWWVLMAASALQGSIMGLIQPSRQAIISDIVKEDGIMNAISLNTMGMNTLQIFAPAVTGFLIDAIGFPAVYYSMTGMYLISTGFSILLPKTPTRPGIRTRAIDNIKAGLNYVWHDAPVLMVLLFSLFVVFFSMPYGTLMPIFAEDILKVGASGMGILLSVSGAGSIVCSIVLASVPGKKRGLLMLLSGIILGLALIGFSFSKSWPLSLTLIAFIGIGQTIRMTVSNTLLQYYVKNEYLGRVMSIYLMQFGFTSLGSFMAGILAEGIGTPWALGSFSLILLAASIVAMFFLRNLRKLD